MNAFFAPQPRLRLEFLRILLPLAILGFMSSRIYHADDWLSTAGYHVPDLGHRDYRQPFYFAPLSVGAAYTLCAVMVASGLMLAAGFRTRIASGVFALCMIYVTLADRLAAFTVSKLGTVLAIALFAVPCGGAWSVDAWLKRRKAAAEKKADGNPADKKSPDKKTAVAPQDEDETVSWGNVRFFQAIVVLLYCCSGMAKAKGDWFTHSNVLWTHMHDSYQTLVTYWVATVLPGFMWKPLQYMVLIFELFAPFWFALPITRLPALFVGLGIHIFIGLCFGPVIWFAMLMAILLLGGFAPLPWLRKLMPQRFA